MNVRETIVTVAYKQGHLVLGFHSRLSVLCLGSPTVEATILLLFYGSPIALSTLPESVRISDIMLPTIFPVKLLLLYSFVQEQEFHFQSLLHVT